MNRIAERVLPVMHDAELHTLIASSYENEAQTLTTGAEANLLKFKELTNTLGPQEAERWESIKKTYQRNVMLRGMGADDKVAQVILALHQCNDHLAAIHHAMANHVRPLLGSVTSNGAGTTLESAAAQAPHPIQIINRVPRVFLEIIQQQFSLMQQWLQPLQQTASASDSRVGHLEQLVQQTLDRYTELLKRLEDGKIVVSLKE
jgi:hypothetical protein